MCAFIFTKSPLKNLCTNLSLLFAPIYTFLHQKAYRARQNPFPTRERKQNFASFLTARFFFFFAIVAFCVPAEPLFWGETNESIFFPSITHQRIVTFRIEILFDFNDTHVNTRSTQHVRCFLWLNPHLFAPRKLLPRKKSNNPKSRDLPFKPKRSARNLYPRETSSPPRCCPSGSSPSATPTRRRREWESHPPLVRVLLRRKSLRPRKSPPRNPRTSRKGKPSSRRRPSRLRLRRDEAEEVCQSPGNPPRLPVVREKPDRRRKRERASINKYNDTLHKGWWDALAERYRWWERERERTLSALD